MRYSPPLDGIRAVAILSVLLFHISPAALRGGFTGVDVFFVLSGFLITSNILHEVHDNDFSLQEFYLRRIQRLLPNMIVMVLVVLLLWTVFMPPSSVHQAATHSVWAIFNLSNFYIWKDLGGYWGSAADSSPLTHTWSLGIEEQFYLLFPGSILLLTRLQPKRIGSWLIAVTILSYGLCLYGTHSHPTATFYLLPTRVWELLVGAVLAVRAIPFRERASQKSPVCEFIVKEALGWVGLLIIGLGYIFITDGAFPGLLSLLPTVGTVLVLLSVTNGKTTASRLLSFTPLVNIGRLSYSIYLWHWPLITLGKALAAFHGKSQLYGSLAGAGAGILLALIAYTGVEKPLRLRRGGRTSRLAIITVGFSATAVFSTVLMMRRPVADPGHLFDTPAFLGELYTAGNANGTHAVTQSPRYYDVYFPPISPNRPIDLWRAGGVIHLYGGGDPQVVVLGSSHALMYSKVIDDICQGMGLSVAFLGVDATPVFFDAAVNFNFTSPSEAREFDETRKKWLRKWHPKVLFMIDRWDDELNTQQEFSGRLHSFLLQVSPMAGHIIFVSQIPAVRNGDQYNLRELVTLNVRDKHKLPTFYPDTNASLRNQSVFLAESEAVNFPNLRVLRADIPFNREDGSIRYESGRSFFYADGNHLSEAGAETVRGLFQSAIAGAK